MHQSLLRIESEHEFHRGTTDALGVEQLFSAKPSTNVRLMDKGCLHDLPLSLLVTMHTEPRIKSGSMRTHHAARGEVAHFLGDEFT